MNLARISSTVFLAVIALSGCDSKVDNAYTLYRNSPLGLTDRVHFATFDADESAYFNGGNCAMAARLLNANFIASATADGKDPLPGAGFWCEKGSYSDTGPVPSTFDTAFPATSDGPLSW